MKRIKEVTESNSDSSLNAQLIEESIRNEAITLPLFNDAMNSLTTEQRKLALQDIHCVPEIKEESPEFLEKMLDEFDSELSNISNKQAYDKAKETSLEYVSNRDFRLMFLRADNFNSKDAAKRMVAHFEIKLDLFGEEVLARNLRLRDFDQVDMQVLRSGRKQILMKRDIAGRAILFNSPSLPGLPLKNRLRMIWWVVLNALNDKETQRNGIVIVVYNIGEKLGSFDPVEALEIPKLRKGLPFRMVAGHGCMDNMITRAIFPVLTSGMTSSLHSRVRLHYGK